MKKIFGISITVVVVAILLVVGAYWYFIGFGDCLNQELYVEGDGTNGDSPWNTVVVPQCAITGTDGTIERVLENWGIDQYVDSIFYNYGTEDDWSSWVKNRPHNSLEEFTAGETYYFYVTEDCKIEV